MEERIKSEEEYKVAMTKLESLMDVEDKVEIQALTNRIMEYEKFYIWFKEFNKAVCMGAHRPVIDLGMSMESKRQQYEAGMTPAEVASEELDDMWRTR